MVGATALQGMGVCPRWRGARASMVLLRCWLLLLLLWLLVVVVVCGGWWVGRGLAPRVRRVGAGVGIAVGQESAVGRRWRRALAPHGLGGEGGLRILGGLIGDREAGGGREGVGITGQCLGSGVLGGRGGRRGGGRGRRGRGGGRGADRGASGRAGGRVGIPHGWGRGRRCGGQRVG